MMNKQINWNLFLIVIPSNRKKNKDWQHFKTSHPPLLAHVRKTCVSTRFGKALPIAIVRENESKLPLFWALQRATLPSQSKNIPHFPLHPGRKESEKKWARIFWFVFVWAQLLGGSSTSPSLRVFFGRQGGWSSMFTRHTHSPTNRGISKACEWVLASARVMRSTWPADVIGGFRDTGVKGWHGAL